MAITQQQYDAYLQQAIDDFAARKGASQVSFSDQSVTFSDWDKIWEWLRFLQAQISNPTAPSRTRYVSTRKGV